jgi:hypothetical protein
VWYTNAVVPVSEFGVEDRGFESQHKKLQFSKNGILLFVTNFLRRCCLTGGKKINDKFLNHCLQKNSFSFNEVRSVSLKNVHFFLCVAVLSWTIFLHAEQLFLPRWEVCRYIHRRLKNWSYFLPIPKSWWCFEKYELE